MRRTHSFVVVLVAFALGGAALFIGASRSFAAASGGTLSGYAWSDNIGWIDLNCANTNSCGTNSFGISIDGSGNLSGYAWSDSIGWISANQADLSGCPSGTCKAKIDSTSNKFSGWLRALSYADGWDGWISLSGASPTYGPSFSNTDGTISGNAWGSDVIGWVDFSLATTDYRACTPGVTYACVDSTTRRQTDISTSCGVTTTDTTCSYLCSGSGCVSPPAPQYGGGGDLTVHPSVVVSGRTTRVSWNVSYVTSCTVQGGGDSWSGVSAGCNSSTHVCSTGAGGYVSSPIIAKRTYTLSCTGLDGSTLTGTAAVNLVPLYKEI